MKKHYIKFMFLMLYVMFLIVGYELICLYVEIWSKENEKIRDFFYRNRKVLLLYFAIIIICVFLWDFHALALLGLFILYTSFIKYRNSKIITFIPLGLFLAAELFIQSGEFEIGYSLPIIWPTGMDGIFNQVFAFIEVIAMFAFLFLMMNMILNAVKNKTLTLRFNMLLMYQVVLVIAFITLITRIHYAYYLQGVDLLANIIITFILLMDLGVTLYINTSEIDETVSFN